MKRLVRGSRRNLITEGPHLWKTHAHHRHGNTPTCDSGAQRSVYKGTDMSSRCSAAIGFPHARMETEKVRRLIRFCTTRYYFTG